MDGTAPNIDPMDLSQPVSATPYKAPEAAQRVWVTLKKITWRMVAIPIFLVFFAIMFAITVGPSLGTDVGKWAVTAVVGIVLLFLMWPKTLSKACINVAKSVVKAFKWIADKSAAVIRWIIWCVWVTLKTIGNGVRYLAKQFWGWISQLTILDWCFIPLWTAVVAAWATLLFWDAKFYAGLAEPGLEFTFMAAGVVFRLFLIFGGLAIIYLKLQGSVKNKGPWLRFTRASKERKKWWQQVLHYTPVPHISLANMFKGNAFGGSARTLRVIWLMALVACLVAAMGFVTDGNDFHYRKAESVQTIGTNSETTADAKIKLAKEEIVRIGLDRDKQVAGARSAAALVLDDGNASNDDVSQYEANARQYQTDAQKLIDAQNAIITQATLDKLAAQNTAAGAKVGDPGVKAVFRQPERYGVGVDSVTMRDAFGLFWVILLELCGAVGAQTLVMVQMLLAKRRMAQANGSLGGVASSKAELRKLITYYNEVSKPKSAPTAPDEPPDPPQPEAKA